MNARGDLKADALPMQKRSAMIVWACDEWPRGTHSQTGGARVRVVALAAHPRSPPRNRIAEIERHERSRRVIIRPVIVEVGLIGRVMAARGVTVMRPRAAAAGAEVARIRRCSMHRRPQWRCGRNTVRCAGR